MISRIRIEACGPTAAAVEHDLVKAAQHMEADLRLDTSFGEQVIQRIIGEPDGSDVAFAGRMILHPNVAHDALQRTVLAYAPPPQPRTLPSVQPVGGLTITSTSGGNYTVSSSL